MDLDQLKTFSGRTCEIELTDGFRALVWVNGVDSTFADHELNLDVITIHAHGGRDDATIPLDAPFVVAAAEVVRVLPLATDAA